MQEREGADDEKRRRRHGRSPARQNSALQANDDETGDGRIDLADLKHQLDRLEAQLALQDRQNRTLLRNQRLRMAVGGAGVLVLVCVLAVVLFFYTRQAYEQVLQASAQVNELALHAAEQPEHAGHRPAGPDDAAMPEIVDQLSKIDVDALNEVLNELPGVLDSVQKLQQDMDQLRSWFTGLGSLFGG